VVVRILEMKNVDISRFEFDYDLVFAAVFMNGHGKIYGRYGSRTPWNSQSRYSLQGLKYTMRQVLDAHDPEQRPPESPNLQPLFARELFAPNRGCIHCHEVWEGLRRRARRQGTFDYRSLFVYPMPENIGLKLDVDAGNRVVHVIPQSASDQAGIKSGDVITKIGDHSIRSQADVSWALHNASEIENLVVMFLRNGRPTSAELHLAAGWKETNLSWRASMRNEEMPPMKQPRDVANQVLDGSDSGD
jgi:hypothetical protein